MKIIQVTDEELEALHVLRNLTSQLSLSKKESEHDPLQKIDMSVAIKSGVDCEFQYAKLNNIDWHIAKLEKQIGVSYFMTGNRHGSTYKCRIRQDHWIYNEWDKCPIPEEGLIIEIEWKPENSNGNDEVYRKTDFYCNIHWHEVNAFRVLGTADGWEY